MLIYRMIKETKIFEYKWFFRERKLLISFLGTRGIENDVVRINLDYTLNFYRYTSIFFKMTVERIRIVNLEIVIFS